MIPAQFPGLLGADADREAQHDVGVQPGLPGRFEQREGLLQGEGPARPPDLALWAYRPASPRSGRRRSCASAYLIARAREARRDLQVPGRQPAAERLQPGAHIPGRQLPERLGADLFQQRRRGLPVHGPRAFRPARQSALEPVVHRLPDRVRGRRMQAAVKLGVQRLELVPHLRLGPAGDLAADPLAVRPEAERDRTDIPVLGRVEVDCVLAMTATARCGVRHRREPNSLAPRLAPCDRSGSPEMGSELVVRDRIELPTFRFSGRTYPQLPRIVRALWAVAGRCCQRWLLLLLSPLLSAAGPVPLRGLPAP